MEKEIAKEHINCRVCNSNNLNKYLDLGSMPLCNNLNNTQEEALDADRYPLEVLYCEDCGLSQLSIVIDPKVLYSYYTYRSGVNGGYIKHCRQMAKNLKDKYNLNENSLVIDIAGNDGTLLKEFYDEIKCNVLNVDPATNLTDISFKEGIRSINSFWSLEVAKWIVQYDKADVITATNVFAHVDNIKEFIEAAKMVLKPDGVLVIECPYVIDHVEKMEYTQVYFEHLSYMSVNPLVLLCQDLDMKVINVEKQEIHGGTIRITITHADSTLKEHSDVEKFRDMEYDKGYMRKGKYKKWARDVDEMIYILSLEIGSLKYKGFKIAGFSASAKGNTLLNSALLKYGSIDYIVDETPEKIGKYSPGTGIPIVSVYSLISTPPDYLLILSWNFKDEIMEKCRKVGYKGRFIIPIPKLEIVE